MYRVITKYRDRGRARPTVEYGPWHPARQDAEFWAEQLRAAGYVVEIESQHGIGGGSGNNDSNNDLAAALASMA